MLFERGAEITLLPEIRSRIGALMVFVAIVLSSCGTSNEEPGVAETDEKKTLASRLLADGESGVAVRYQDVVYRMDIAGDCGAASDGTFSNWAVTLDSDGAPGPKQPHMHVLSEEGWSVIDFYRALDDRIIRIHREGQDKFGFVDGSLLFDGPIDSGAYDLIRVEFVCPK